MFIAIVQRTPVWVWGLLALLVALGVRQMFSRRLALRRSAVLPLVLLGLSLAGVVGSFGVQALPLLAWAAGLAAMVAVLQGRVDTQAVRYDSATRQFQVPGSAVPLALMLGLFMLKYAAGVALAMNPWLRATLPFALTISLTYGIFSGAFLGRAMALWALARRSTPAMLGAHATSH